MTIPADIRLIRPASLAEALAARRQHSGARLLAGGTDLIPNFRRGIGGAIALIDIAGLRDLQTITMESAGLRIGAGVTLDRLSRDPLIDVHFPALAAAARQVAGPAHRTIATLGGNLCVDTRCIFYNQSAWWRQSNGFCLKHRGDRCHVAPTGKRCYAAYSGDTAPVLLALGAAVELGGVEGTRVVPLDSFFNEDGAAHLCIGDDEILLGVRAPVNSGCVTAYEKTRFRGAIDFPLAGVAVSLRREKDVLGDLRIAVTGTNSRPVLLTGIKALIGRSVDNQVLQEIGKFVQKQVSPMRTTLVPAHYRRRVAAATAVRLVRRLYAAQG